MNRIEFRPFGEADIGVMSQLGGGAWLPCLDDWPVTPDTKEPLLPIMTIRPDFFPTVRFKSPDLALTIFVSVEYTGHGYDRFYDGQARKFAANDRYQFKALVPGYARIILHPVGPKELFAQTDFPYIPKHAMAVRSFTNEEIEEELADPDMGLDASKFLGRPAWLQDPIYEGPKHSFEIQIRESDIMAVSPEHEGIFHEGTGYVFIANNLNRLDSLSEGGIFIVQFT